MGIFLVINDCRAVIRLATVFCLDLTACANVELPRNIFTCWSNPNQSNSNCEYSLFSRETMGRVSNSNLIYKPVFVHQYFLRVLH